MTSNRADIGTNLGATGVATVSGVGSQWIIQGNTNLVFVGRFGSGTLEISNEGLVRNSGEFIIGASSGPGSLNVSTNGVLETKRIGSYGMGTLNLNGGILRALESRSDFLTGFSPQTLGNDGAIFDTNGFDIGVSTAFASLASQNSGLRKLGLGKLTLTANNSYNGTTTISAGTLQLGNGGTIGSVTGAITNNGTLAVNRSNALTLGQVISGSGKLEQAGTGTTTLTANNSYGGGTTISAGTLQLGNGGTTGTVTGAITNNGTLAVNRSNALTLGQVISGSGKLEQAGTGTTTLTANNSYNGTTTISAGTLQLGNGGTTGSLGSGAINIGQGAVLAVNRSNSVTLGQVISGDGSLRQNGANTTTLTATNTYTGGTTINQGKLALGSGGSLAATGAVNLASSGTTFDISAASGSQTVGALSGVADSTVALGSNALTFGDGSNQTLAATVTGASGSLIKNGTGTTWLTGSNTYTGDTTVNGGKLLVGNAAQGGSVASNVLVNTGAALGGSGSIGDNVTVGSGGTLLPGNSPGTLTIGGDLTLIAASGGNPGSTTTFELGQAGAVGGVSNDLIKVGGSVNLGGTLDATVASAGWYRLINYGTSGSGSVKGQFDSTALHSSSSFDASKATASVLTTVPKQVNLAVVGQNQTLQLWNGANGNTWDANTVNWTNDAPTSGVTSGWQGSVAVFGTDTGATSGIVTVSGQQSFDTLQFSSSGYTVAAATSADGLLISPASSSNPQIGIINVDPGVSAEISAGIANGTASSLTLVGPGTLTLSGQNSYTGGTTVSKGKLVAASNSALGTGSVTVNGSTSALNVISGISLNNAVTLGNEATLNNSGTLTATGTTVSSTSGPVTVNNSSGAFINPGAGGIAIKLQGGGAVSNAGEIGNSAANVGVSLQAGGSIDNQKGSTIVGTQSVQAAGSSAVSLRNAGKIIGNVQLDSSAANGVTLLTGSSLTGNLNIGTNTGSTLALDGTGNQSYSSAVTGDTTLAGALTKAGTGPWTLDKNLGGGFAPTSTTIVDGTLALSGAGSLGSSSSLNLSGSSASLDISTANAGQTVSTFAGVTGSQIHLGANQLSFGDNSNQSFAGRIDGSGGITKTGAGTQTLSGTNSYTGTTTISAGTLQLGDGTVTGQSSIAGNIANNGALVINNLSATTLAGKISGTGTLTQQGTGTTTLTSTANNYTGATQVAQGTLQAGATNTFSSSSAYTVATGATLDLAGYNQTLASLNNSGMVKLSSNGGGTPGTVLKVTGAYVGNGGTLGLSTVLAADGSATDKLLLSGSNAVASGSTIIQITNAGGLGGQTMGTGIQVVGTENGGSLQANSFTLAGEHVDAGAYEYRLFQTAQGATLQSTDTLLAYRSEVPLMSALPAQLRQADMSMLGDMHRRMGDDNVQASNGAGTTSADLGQNRRVWGRILRTDPTIHQQGTVTPESSGHMTGFQAGLDLYANQSIKAGIYVGQLDGDMSTTGFAGGINSKYVGFNTLHSRYLGVYGNWKDASGLYADTVLQGADYRSQLHKTENTGANAATTKGRGWLVSLEVGKPFALNSNWQIEPQAQLIYRKISLDDTALSLATVKNRADDDWTLRLGARIKGSFTTSAGMLQPYGRINLYKASSTTDVASFVVPAATTDIKAKGGYTSTELAAGASLQVRKSTSLYGELGKLWANGGDSRVKSGVQASVGIKVLW